MGNFGVSPHRSRRGLRRSFSWKCPPPTRSNHRLARKQPDERLQARKAIRAATAIDADWLAIGPICPAKKRPSAGESLGVVQERHPIQADRHQDNPATQRCKRSEWRVDVAWRLILDQLGRERANGSERIYWIISARANGATNDLGRNDANLRTINLIARGRIPEICATRSWPPKVVVGILSGTHRGIVRRRNLKGARKGRHHHRAAFKKYAVDDRCRAAVNPAEGTQGRVDA
jgi:hypothetical protein